MRLEQIPILIGVFVALVGIGFILDARLPDRFTPGLERRRRVRTERHRHGELLVGLGTLGMAASLIGRDTWRFGTLAVLLGALLLVAGAWLNLDYLREMLTFRGPARRTEDDEVAPLADGPVARSRPLSAATPADRFAPALRSDREAPIVTAREADAVRGDSVQQDTIGADSPRKRLGLHE